MGVSYTTGGLGLGEDVWPRKDGAENPREPDMTFENGSVTVSSRDNICAPSFDVFTFLNKPLSLVTSAPYLKRFSSVELVEKI